MLKHAIYIVAAAMIAAAALLIHSRPSEATESIIRQYQSPRAVGMGGVVLTTGFYQENFFYNPARITENPEFRVQLFDPQLESTPSTLSTLSDLVSSDDVLADVADEVGNNIHARIQFSFPGVYSPPKAPGKLGWGVALMTSFQADVSLRQSYRIEPRAFLDIGPALTVGRTFLKGNKLAIGVTTHLTARVSSRENFSFVDLLQGASLSPLKSGGDGAHLDFGVGSYYKVPWSPLGLKLSTAITVSNILGGKYKNLGIRPADLPNRPSEQKRAFGAGIAARKASLWKFTDLVFAFELQNIGNNSNGSMYRTFHLGGEARYGVLRPRIGLYQGYLSGGLGIHVGILEVDLATYGEELTLNPGGLQDRRYAARIALHI